MEVLGDCLFWNPFSSQLQCKEVPQQLNGSIKFLLDGLVRVSRHSLPRTFLKMLRDPTHAMNIDTDDLPNLMLTNTCQS